MLRVFIVSLQGLNMSVDNITKLLGYLLQNIKKHKHKGSLITNTVPKKSTADEWGVQQSFL